MAQNVNPTFVKTPNRGLVELTTGTGSSGLVTVYLAGTNGSKIVGMWATASTTTAQDLQWGITNNASTFYLMGTVSIPAGAGSTDSIPAVNLMSSTAVPGMPLDSDGNYYLLLASTADALQAKSPTLIGTTGGLITVTAISGDF